MPPHHVKVNQLGEAETQNATILQLFRTSLKCSSSKKILANFEFKIRPELLESIGRRESKFIGVPVSHLTDYISSSQRVDLFV
jgi:hypothetical protein